MRVFQPRELGFEGARGGVRLKILVVPPCAENQAVGREKKGECEGCPESTPRYAGQAGNDAARTDLLII